METNIFLPEPATWRISTDHEERGGKSALAIYPGNTSDSLRFSGKLGSLAGRLGPVGFVSARFPWPRPTGRIAFREMHLHAGWVEPVGLIVDWAIYPTDEYLNRCNWDREGTIAFHCSFSPVRNAFSEIRLPLAEFSPECRGRTIPNQPPLDPAEIDSIGILIKRSSQAAILSSEIPTPFHFLISGPIQLVN